MGVLALNWRFRLWQPCNIDIGETAFFSVGGNYLVGDHFGKNQYQQSAFALTTRYHDMQHQNTSRMVPLAALYLWYRWSNGVFCFSGWKLPCWLPFGQNRHQQTAFALKTRCHDMQHQNTSRMVPLEALYLWYRWSNGVFCFSRWLLPYWWPFWTSSSSTINLCSHHKTSWHAETNYLKDGTTGSPVTLILME